jgi:DNA (cytosine-5)-methyltransferase 1
MKNGKHKEPTVGSLYAGIGGICRAFEKAGAKLLWANEFDPHAQLTYRKNFQHTLLTKDISYYEERLDRLVSENAPLGERILRPDILTSGFPCQAFSIAGRRLGFEDLRGLHFFKTMSFLEKLQPSAYLFENVKNLQSHNKGDTIETIKDTIHKAGYSYVIRVLNTMIFGNVPQNRERVFIVGFKGEAHFNNPEHNKMASTLSAPKTEAFLSLFPKPVPLKKSVRDLLQDKVDQVYYYKKFSCYKTLQSFVKKTHTVYQWRRVYARENKSNVCPTLTANMGTGGHNVPLVLDSKGIRKLTPRECARFQGFKDRELIFPKNMANSHLYKQLGNSVTVPVVERLAHAIIQSIKIS